MRNLILVLTLVLGIAFPAVAESESKRVKDLYHFYLLEAKKDDQLMSELDFEMNPDSEASQFNQFSRTRSRALESQIKRELDLAFKALHYGNSEATAQDYARAKAHLSKATEQKQRLLSRRKKAPDYLLTVIEDLSTLFGRSKVVSPVKKP